MTKLTRQDKIGLIRDRDKRNWSLRKLAKEYGISQTHVARILKRRDKYIDEEAKVRENVNEIGMIYEDIKEIADEARDLILDHLSKHIFRASMRVMTEIMERGDPTLIKFK